MSTYLSKSEVNITSNNCRTFSRVNCFFVVSNKLMRCEREVIRVYTVSRCQAVANSKSKNRDFLLSGSTRSEKLRPYQPIR